MRDSKSIKEFDKTEEIEKYKKEIKKLNNKSLKLLEKNLESIILEEIFYKKSRNKSGMEFFKVKTIFTLRK